MIQPSDGERAGRRIEQESQGGDWGAGRLYRQLYRALALPTAGPSWIPSSPAQHWMCPPKQVMAKLRCRGWFVAGYWGWRGLWDVSELRVKRNRGLGVKENRGEGSELTLDTRKWNSRLGVRDSPGPGLSASRNWAGLPLPLHPCLGLSGPSGHKALPVQQLWADPGRQWRAPYPEDSFQGAGSGAEVLRNEDEEATMGSEAGTLNPGPREEADSGLLI